MGLIFARLNFAFSFKSKRFRESFGSRNLIRLKYSWYPYDINLRYYSHCILHSRYLAYPHYRNRRKLRLSTVIMTLTTFEMNQYSSILASALIFVQKIEIRFPLSVVFHLASEHNWSAPGDPSNRFLPADGSGMFFVFFISDFSRFSDLTLANPR